MPAHMYGTMNPFRIGGDIVHLLSFYFLLSAIRRSKTVVGVSIRTQELMFVVFACRYVDLAWEWTMPYNVMMKLLFLGTTLYVVTNLRSHRRPDDDELDKFSRLILIIPCGVTSAIFVCWTMPVPSLFDFLWTLSICLESVAVLPQLFLLQKHGSVENLTSHYVATVGLYRVLYLINWLYRWFLYQEWTPLIVWISGIIQIILYMDFFYHYFRSKRNGLDREVLLPA